MIFNDSKPIYQQIAEIVCDKIASHTWLSDERIPSVRELGSELEVNPNTVMRAYEWLSEQGIIYNKRGIGFFVGSDAVSAITKERKSTLLNHEIKAIAQRVAQLNIPIDEVIERLREELKQLNK